MKERPILMTGENVIATLEKRKTQTRRLNGLEDVNQYPGRLFGNSSLGPLGYRGLEISDYNLKPEYKRQFKKTPGIFHWFLGEQLDQKEINPIPVKCPYGEPGDLLWVRETWDFVVWDEHEIIISYGADGQQSRPIKYPSAWNPTIYNYQRWRPSIFMPRWASRLILKIMNIKSEQLWFITEQDILSEGIDGIQIGQEGCEKNKGKFIELWDSINTKRGYPWSSNPWVWVIDYEVIDGEVTKIS